MASEANKDRLIDKAKASAEGRRGQPDDLPGFLNELFSAAPEEDVLPYGAEELAELAIEAREFVASARKSSHAIRVYNPHFPDLEGTQHEQVTVVEVLNDNMPFLVDSVLGALQHAGADIRLVVHPILCAARNKAGKLTELSFSSDEDEDAGRIRESFIHIHVERMEVGSDRDALAELLNTVMAEVRSAVTDWPSMVKRLDQAIEDYKTNPPPMPVEEIAEALHFLQWLADNNFTFLGMREYIFKDEGDIADLIQGDEPGLGLLSNPDVRVLRRGKELVSITPEVLEFLKRPEPLIVAKANVRTMVHRRAYMDYIGVKIFDESGKLSGELRIVGLFTSTAYTRSARRIPFLRRKLEHVIHKSKYDADSHSGKALINILESYPRDELFQVDADTLSGFAMAILQLEEHPRIRVLARRDRFDRYVSVLVYVPRDRYTSEVRERVGNYLKSVYDGRLSAYYPSFPEGSLARVHFIIGRDGGETPNPSRDELEAEVSNIVKTWADRLRVALYQDYDPVEARLLLTRYADAFSAAYVEAYPIEAAVSDLCIAERLRRSGETEIKFYRRPQTDRNEASLKVFSAGQPVPLSDRIPVLENMGFRVIDERTYELNPDGDDAAIFIHDMTLVRPDGGEIDVSGMRDRFEACFLAIWTGQAEDDGYNALVTRTDLDWRAVAVLRTISRYLRQVRIPYSQDYMWTTLGRYNAIASRIWELFEARFDPAKTGREKATDRIQQEIAAELEAVDSLDDDRILRRFENVVMSTLRTNFFHAPKEDPSLQTIAFKIDPRAVDEMPDPKPFREIFVYSPRVEGVHLRFGEVARGGLRWSDRPQDFRTEVLGLVKAQQVKNAVIVPVGAKGGFVPKQLPVGGSRDEFFAEGTEAYKVFIGSLLEITDNLDGQTVLPPERTIRHDNDDPYLVVAADKGTATFSDTANAISQSKDFWMDDAFASGGSAGYDHKKMGITARGGWEAVKRHFREMDHDIQTEPFTAIGVGDMSGDVFGNGMLLSKATKVVAAFDHRDIFIDPDPDPAKSWVERKRLFDMGRSSWQDYDTSLISKGGGVFSRAEKSITLSKEIKALLGLDADKTTPQELMKAILRSHADLLWFGGIGTYIRANDETDLEVGDRANDAIRITVDELNVKVIGEGANLGVTQKTRIAFNLRGGRCNSDAIDNSAGVNSSDVEVNIKIALGAAVRQGKLDIPSRNVLLEDMTEEVAALVLRNNYLQTLAISLDERRGMEDFGYQVRFMQGLEARGLLNRQVEELPDNAELIDREQKGVPLTRAEIGVLLAYAKLTLYDDLLASDVPDDPYLSKELVRYFPSQMQSTYSDEIEAHRLRREIIATMLANSMINRGGPTFLTRVVDQTGATAPDVVRAFAAVRDGFDLLALNLKIDALDTKIPGAVQLALYQAVQEVVLNQTTWFHRNIDFSDGLSEVVGRFRKAVDTLLPKIDTYLPDYLVGAVTEEIKGYEAVGVPTDLARHIALLPVLGFVPDMLIVSERTGKPLTKVAEVYFAIAGYFQIGRIDALARKLEVADYYDGLALDRARNALADAHRNITTEVLAMKGGFDAWINSQGERVGRTRETVAGVTEGDAPTVSKFAVAAGLLADLARA
ncbi:NAD-glutamate dehydrogenase [Coralliovum pocilloporae]|uniref:NAD-glutamate dehydrogenase n=1 Tax=Coralliovum pocilloporae TaxID=3066369 RepID=UPI003306E61C